MKPYYQEPNATIYQGHAVDVLKELEAESVDCVMTSPPYWGLRTYKTEPIIWNNHRDCEHEWNEEEALVYENKPGQHWQAAYGGATGKNRFGYGNTQLSRQRLSEKHITGFCLKCHAWKGSLGLEPTIELYISHLLQIFDEIKRVLKKTGTCWVNLDDSYASGKGTCFNPGGGKGSYSSHGDRKDAGVYPLDCGNISMLRAEGLLPKSLCLIPQRFAIAMINNGWILRNDICWNKNNPMPESVKDRFTGSWEHLYFFVKSQRYWFEQQFEPVLPQSIKRDSYGYHGAFKGRYDVSWEKRAECKDQSFVNPLGRNKRDVWELNTEACPFRGVHFATFPEKLVETPILSGCPSAICKKCGKARERIYEKTGHTNKREPAHQPGNSPTKVDSTGWALTEMPSSEFTDCGCNAGFEPGVAMDIFAGIGTTRAVAKRLGRKYIGIELSPEYCKLHIKRLQSIPLAIELL